jgi:predicted DNA-binding transcriptional regulator YafY
MIRRTFFELLSGAFFPRPIWHSAHLGETLPPNPVAKATAASVTIDPEWLREWLRLPRLPLLTEDFSVIPNLKERSLVALILVSIGLGEPFQFQYFGGSEPGKSRRVLPVMLFTTRLDDVSCGVGTPNPIYLLGWCQTRQAARTFRLDRIRVDGSLSSGPDRTASGTRPRGPDDVLVMS